MFHESITCCYLYVITKYGYPPPAERTLQYLEEMHALGFRSVELEGIREPHLRAVHEQRNEIAEKVRTLGLKVPYFCAVLPGLSSADAEERNQNLALFDLGCEVARRLGSKGILDNAPLPPYRFPEDIPIVRHYGDEVMKAASWPSGLSWNRYWSDLVDTLREACDRAAARGLTYQLHPALGVLAATTDGFLYLYDAVDRDNLRFTLDTANQFMMRENLSLAVRRLAPFIDYVHVSDNRGHRVEHLPLGDGDIRWSDFFRALSKVGFSGHLGVDVGGDESGVTDLDAAYVKAAHWLSGTLRPSQAIVV
ncbi:MAG TPA: sugar phosphate isomerase/epimerase family protein [Rhodothermales bacterium]